MNPTNPNKLTAIIMIVLGFALLFIIGATYQSYQNGLTGNKILQVTSERISAIEKIVSVLKSGQSTANLTGQNKIILEGILNEIEDLNNKTDDVVKNFKEKKP